ncbi:OmpA family protein [Ferrimonas sediminum]|uniref:OmpA family protein n=1 Tax=Ferrimonas sediminum TaxID=718193 RepID=A0A1G8S8G9_9GAMM|nr:OmpA family protein [Ferrimonas sediminum]SDJ25000.1 OmpA family protein [Ferrimonas sediminum]
MKKRVSITLMLLLAGCAQWPEEGQGQMAAEGTPWDSYLLSPAFLQEHQALRQRVVEAQIGLELLRLRGTVACLPERQYQAEQRLGQIRGEVAEGLYADASEQLLILEDQIHRLGVRLNFITQHMGCRGVEQGVVTAGGVNVNEVAPGLLQSEQFALDRDELLPEFQLRLRQMAQMLRDNPRWVLTVTGHTDDQGDDQHNQALALARANAVSDHLQADGVPQVQLRVVAAGSSMPLAPNTNRSGRLANRRVSFELLALPSETASSPAPLTLSQWPESFRRE